MSANTAVRWDETRRDEFDQLVARLVVASVWLRWLRLAPDSVAQKSISSGSSSR